MELPKNLKEKIWRIPDGIPLQLGDTTIRIDHGKFLVTGWVPTINFDNVDRHRVLNELKDLKADFQQLTDLFPELEDIKNRNNLEVEYHMAYDDQGKVAIGLCSEMNGGVQWYI